MSTGSRRRRLRKGSTVVVLDREHRERKAKVLRVEREAFLIPNPDGGELPPVLISRAGLGVTWAWPSPEGGAGTAGAPVGEDAGSGSRVTVLPTETVTRRCPVDGCELMQTAAGFCAVHMDRICMVVACTNVRAPKSDFCAAHSFPAKCARQGCSRDAAEGMEICATCYASSAAPVIPSDSQCARLGCTREKAEGREFCTGHLAAARAVVAAVEVRAAIARAYEAAWVALAEDASLDPVTVATCKALRDQEVRS